MRLFGVLFFLGFASGLPLALTGSTLQAWLSDVGISLKTIGIFSLVGLPYTLKIGWAPLLDRYSLWKNFGRRKDWLLFTQGAMILTLFILSECSPIHHLSWLIVGAIVLAFFSASQDLVFDAYRTEMLSQDPRSLGMGASLATLGYRVGMLVSGAFALVLADQFSWKWVYQMMAAFMGIGVLATFLAPPLPKNLLSAAPPQSLEEAFILPFADFFKRKSLLSLLGFILTYKLDTVFTLALMTPFLLQLGFTKTEVGAVSKGVGLFSALLGTFVGGLWFQRLGLHRSLWVFGLLQGAAGLNFWVLAQLGASYPWMVWTLAAENFFSSMGNTAYLAFLMSLCRAPFTATQFSLVSSLMAFTRSVASAPSGWFVEELGWSLYFLLGFSLMIPSFLFLLYFKQWNSPPR